MFSGQKSRQAVSRQHAYRPEALALDFVIRPQSKVDPEEIRARAKQTMQDQRRQKVISFNVVFINRILVYVWNCFVSKERWVKWYLEIFLCFSFLEVC